MPARIGVRRRLFRLVREFHGDGLARLRPSPDVNRCVALKHHVVAEKLWQPGLGGNCCGKQREQQSKQHGSDSHLGNSPEPLNTHVLILWPAPQRNNPRVNSLSTSAPLRYHDVN
jgi:hypothetical protein